MGWCHTGWQGSKCKFTVRDVEEGRKGPGERKKMRVEGVGTTSMPGKSHITSLPPSWTV
jgi:hypothetical protein